jgi:hypothetical protein
MLKAYTQALQHYFAEEPEYHEVLFSEERLEAELKTVDGDILPLPAVGIPDLVHQRADGGIEIIDTKFVKSFTPYENDDGEPHEDYIKIIQAQFLWHLLRSAKQLTADRIIFREIKIPKNKDNTPQVRDYVIPFDHEPYRIIFYNIYKDVVAFISNPDSNYLPTLGDQFDGEQSGLLYAQGLISADMSDVEVMHKVADVAFVSKKFITSRLDKIENAYLPPEQKIKVRLAEFGIPVQPQETVVGTAVTQYRFKVSAGVRMSTFAKHKADIALAIEAKGEIRILAPIPGTNLVGIEVENEVRTSTKLTPKYFRPTTLDLPLGTDVSGTVHYLPLATAPHVLIAGTTGSGKSVLLNNMITALTKQLPPARLHLTLIDPKRVELAAYGKLPHLHGKRIIYEYEDALRALLSLVEEMETRYESLEAKGVRDIEEYNAKGSTRYPYQVVVFDEFADFMIRAKNEEKRQTVPSYGSKTKPWLQKELTKRADKEKYVWLKNEDDTDGEPVGTYIGNSSQLDRSSMVELLEQLDLQNPIIGATVEPMVVRLAQMGRAAGIHIILATQRPSVDVITGLIKANFPTRIALTTASDTDSKVILGNPGAEKLGGKGDMLYRFPGNKGDVRLQGFTNS